jgi:hypothetical protein
MGDCGDHISTPSAPVVVGSLEGAVRHTAVAVDGSYAYISLGAMA